MKALEWIKIFKMTHPRQNLQKKFFLTVNESDVEKVSVVVNPSSFDTYKMLRTFATPQYDLMFLMRNKKAFNTVLFQQNYDIVVCDKNFRVIKLFPDTVRGFISEHISNGYFIYFGVVGTINFLNLKQNDRLKIKRTFIY